MASRPLRDPAFISAAGWRLLALLLLAPLAARLLDAGYALSAALAAAAAGLVLFDLWRLTRAPLAGAAPAGAAAADARRLEEALALIDGVPAALLVAAPDGRILFANRAARALAGPEPGRLDDIAALGAAGVAALCALAPGGRRLIEGADGRTLLASVQELAVPAAAPRRLIALQPVAGELDAVESAAWRRMGRVLAHELMNSLTPVTSLAESLRDMAGTEPRIARAAATIARRSAHLLAFVGRYREVADVPAPKPVPVAVAALLGDLDNLVGAKLRAGGIDFVVAAPSDLTVAADPVLLEQALLNLVRNAAEAIGERPGGRISVVARAGRDRVAFEVADNGPGFDPAASEEMFVPFHTTKPGGAGIGLPLVREIATAHGGHARAATGPDGATFTVELPIAGR